MFTLITYLNTVWEVLASAKNARIGNKRPIDEKEKKKKKLPPFADYMIIFVENSKEPTKTKKNLLEQTSKFSKAAVYKISTQNSTVFLYASN